MKNLPVVEGLLNYIKENNAPFSMPGHKGGRAFMNREEGTGLQKIMVHGDITEVEGLDNYHDPKGIIKEGQNLLKELYGSEESYFLVNGSTSGNLVMIFSTFKEGDKILVERNCHKSIFNAIILRKLQPIYIKNLYSSIYNAPISIDMEHFLRLIEKHSDIKGIILTYPNYYGTACDLATIIEKCKEKGIKVLIDCAHGAHFGISEMLPENPMKLGAHMAVMSAHKTLPSLTQTAYLHLGRDVDKNKVKFYLSAFSSTSPSYIFMASMDYARFYLSEYGKEEFENCISLVEKYGEKIDKLQGFSVWKEEDIHQEYPKCQLKMDRSRLVIHVDEGYSAHLILDYLREKGLQCEMSDGYNLVLIASPFNSLEDYKRLYDALKQCPLDKFKVDFHMNWKSNLPEVGLLPWEALESEVEEMNLNDSVGRISAANIVPYPPGIPLIMMGEIIDKFTVNMIQYCIRNGVTILGFEGNKIKVVKR
ncbi:Arginine decarboxylase [Clostridium sp. N3C]|uniref:aminotransferase class I/II-fold pyridoxal phosphate-dependent enzyme n=1 Tax=Clostridium sp. N3C TaxID=1776758 RepID=UPI00092E1F4D|nr:aminotransferase class I/II-fold pyridoxal phosphate-dependent enzyme [Clostridium sp. N3C]SCN23189.1 Arginine decarboxylase [Clostridium sp. N3C]